MCGQKLCLAPILLFVTNKSYAENCGFSGLLFVQCFVFVKVFLFLLGPGKENVFKILCLSVPIMTLIEMQVILSSCSVPSYLEIAWLQKHCGE